MSLRQNPSFPENPAYSKVAHRSRRRPQARTRLRRDVSALSQSRRKECGVELHLRSRRRERLCRPSQHGAHHVGFILGRRKVTVDAEAAADAQFGECVPVHEHAVRHAVVVGRAGVGALGGSHRRQVAP